MTLGQIEHEICLLKFEIFCCLLLRSPLANLYKIQTVALWHDFLPFCKFGKKLPPFSEKPHPLQYPLAHNSSSFFIFKLLPRMELQIFFSPNCVYLGLLPFMAQGQNQLCILTETFSYLPTANTVRATDDLPSICAWS